MKVGSLFSGIGGFDLGLEWAGMEVVWQAESEPFCRAVLKHHWPHVPCFEDVRQVNPDTAEPVDLICGGFPCQDISLAGRGAGIDGEHSGLWAEIERCVRLFGPRWVVVENVPALASRGLDRVLRDLAAVGYDAEWDCLPASAFGAPHRRDRIWIVAYPAGGGLAQPQRGNGSARDSAAEGTVADSSRNGEARPAAPARAERERARASGEREPLADPELTGSQRHRRGAVRAEAIAGSGAGGGEADLADSKEQPERAGLRESGPGGLGRRRPSDGGSEGNPWLTEPDLGRVADGIPARVDRLASLGNACVPQVAEWIGRRIIEAEQMSEAQHG